ncbi:MAG: tRNA (adenosine(37)-N6)-dimethylallyltransferase MiaA [Planctomycetota bacterium]
MPRTFDPQHVGFLVGTTAAGKSAVALALAERADAEIVSLDSMQVYRGMDIGTAKPSAAERARVRHHMLDLVAPNESYDVQRYLADVVPVLAALADAGRRVLVVGGTAFYLKALVSGLFEGPPVDRALRAAIEERAREHGNAALHAALAGIDPRAAARIHANDTKRVVRALEVFEQTGRTLSDWQTQWPSRSTLAVEDLRCIALDVATTDLDERIRARTRAMLDGGWPAEAARIRADTGFGTTAVQALGYADALALHDGVISREECAERIALVTRQFARRQRTWYRKLSGAHWFEAPRELVGVPVDEMLDALGWRS